MTTAINKHLPSDLWKSPAIRARLYQEACFDCDHGISDKKHIWVFVPMADTKDGGMALKNYEPSIQDADPHEQQQQMAMELQKFLQKDHHFDGIWIVGYTHPPSSYGVITDTENCWYRMIMIWLDSYGDPQYTVEFERPFFEMFQDGPDYFIQQAHTAHQAWLEVYGPKAMKRDMELKDGQQRAVALEALKTV